MAHELANTEETEADEISKDYPNRRDCLKTGAAATAIVAGTGLGLTTSASGDSSTQLSTGFGKYIN